MVSLPVIFYHLMKTFVKALDIKQMCELILSDIWSFLCNFLQENEKNKFKNRLSKK